MCHYNKGINHRRLDELSESIKELEEAKSLLNQMQEQKASLHNNLGLTLFEQDQMEEAIKEFDIACKLEGSAVHFNNKGLAYFHYAIREENTKE